MFKNPVFWLIFLTLSVCAFIFSYIYFPKALPLLDLHISMNKEQALQKAIEVAHTYKLGPDQFCQAAYFNSENDVQNYIELEQGGASSFQYLIEHNIYQPYTWQIRHYKEGVSNETVIKFTPNGELYGFIEKIDENEPGSAPNLEEATKIAQDFITKWHPNLQDYQHIENCHETRPNGRIDYTFVYEKLNCTPPLLDIKCRFTIVISGNKVTTVSQHIHIPESFERKYNNLRSTNKTIGSIGLTIMYLLYLFGGCLFGLLFLIRKNMLISRPALIIGISIAAAQIFAQFNQISLIWFSYPTAFSASTYLIQHVLGLFVLFFLWSIIYSVSLMVAEGLGRVAFGHHIQFWKSFSPPVASSYSMLGLTISSYLFVAFDFAFVIIFYIVGTRFFNLWIPSGALTNPNILTTYAPALGALALALGAGFWEECLFRAVPLSIAALIGNFFGYRKTAISIGFVLQALIFGAVHANYPALPGYIRVLELIIPSFSFGLFYLAFGLIPGIIIHFVYDAILFSLPIFISDAPGIWFQKLLVALGIIFPFIIIILGRIKTKKWAELTPNIYNYAWQPQPQTLIYNTLEPEELEYTVSRSKKAIIFLFGSIGFLLWIKTTTKESDLAIVQVTKQEAVRIAKQKLTDININDRPWRILPHLQTCAESNFSSHFIWQKGGKELFDQLKDQYLDAPRWNVRFATFEGDINKRAEEVHIFVNCDGTISRIKHILPENTAGKILTEDQARNLAQQTLTQKFNLREIKEISSACHKLPARTDWTFRFSDPTYKLDDGQACTAIEISGDKITDTYQYIHVPDNWIRTEQHKKPIEQIISIINMFCLFVIALIAVGKAVYLWQMGTFPLTFAFGFGALYGSISLLVRLANLPETLASLLTSQSFYTQIFSLESMSLVSIIIESAFISLIFGVIYQTTYKASIISKRAGINLPIFIGLTAIGTLSLAEYLIYPSSPTLPNLLGASAYVPWLVYGASFLILYVRNTLYLILLNNFAQQKSMWRACVSLLLSAFLLSSYNAIGATGHWLLILCITSILIIITYRLLIKFDSLIIPVITATPLCLNLFKHCLMSSYPGAFAAGIITTIILPLSSLILIRALKKSTLYEFNKEASPNLGILRIFTRMF